MHYHAAESLSIVTKKLHECAAMLGLLMAFLLIVMPSAEAATVRIMPLGDSITEGQSNTANYRLKLSNLLNQNAISAQFVGSMTSNTGGLPTGYTHHEGHSGWCSTDAGSVCQQGNTSWNASRPIGILEHIDAWLTATPSDIVLLLIGTNDGGSASTLGTNVATIVDKIHAKNAAAKVLVSGLHTNGNAMSYQNSAIQSAINGKPNTLYINAYSGFNDATDFADQLHPNSSGYDKMATNWFNAIQSVLATTTTTTTVVAKHSGKCLDVRGGVAATGNGALIEQWSCSGLSNQAWTLKDMGGAQFEFIAANSGKCLDVINGGTANGTGIQQSDCTGATRQLWKLGTLSTGQYQIVSVSSNRCLDVTGGPTATADGVLTELWDCTGQANQSWALTVPAAAPPSTIVGPVVAQHSGKCLDVRGGVAATANGVLIEQWSCTGLSNQSWTLKDMGSSQYQLIAGNSGKCLDLVGGGTGNGNGIQQSDCLNVARQLWKVVSLGSGQNQIISVAANRCLDVTGGPTATGDGVLTELWDCTSQSNQSWTVGTAPPSSPPTGTPGPYGQNAAGYTLTFSDEFDGTSLDTKKWGDHGWYLPPDPTPNYAVSGGSLKIWPVAGTSYTRDYRHITTDGLYYQTYGYFEIEAKLPYGKGPWPAFWLYNHDDSGDFRPEIDIMEAYSGGGPSSGWSDSNLHPTAYGATIWTGAPGAQGGYKMIQTPDLSAGFHKYAVKWEANKQSFYFDGNLVYTANVSMGNRMYILLSFQFGSASGSGDASTPTGQSNSYEVRYVRAWKIN
jgi:lysophospholipase L1-like esterase